MAHDIEELMHAAAPDPTREANLADIERRGRQLTRRARLGTVLALVATLGAAAALLQLVPSLVRSDSQITDTDRVPPDTSRDKVVESMTEQEAAEIFAFRAVAATQLMDRQGRSYLFTSEEDTTRTADGWRIGFAASECTPFTCRGVSGENALGNARTDTFVIARLQDGEWTVVDVEGNVLEEDRKQLLGYSLRDRDESSHWEFPALDIGSPDEGFSVTMFSLWVGPYPTTAPGSVCEIQPIEEDGEAAGEATVFYAEPPDRAFERAGGVHIRGVPGAQPEAETASVNCRQYTGDGWEVASEPKVLRNNGGVFGVEAELVWRGERGFTTPAICQVTLVDAAGDEVWEGTGRIEALWRSSELKDYPYRANIVITPRGESVDGESIEDFSCTSR